VAIAYPIVYLQDETNSGHAHSKLFDERSRRSFYVRKRMGSRLLNGNSKKKNFEKSDIGMVPQANA
jgi:hypothetical protein